MTSLETWSLPAPLVGKRVVLRAHRASDLDDLVVFHGDDRVTQYIPWPVRDREQTAAALEVKLSQDVARAVGDWIVLAVEERDSRTVIGEVLLKRADEGVAEVGYAFRHDRQGAGLASESVQLLLDHAVPAFGLVRVDATVEDPNTSSIRLLERLGFTPSEGPSAGDGEPALLRFSLHLPSTESGSDS